MTSPPDGIAIRLPELIALRGEARRLDLAPRGRVLAVRSGGHLSRLRGRGMEFDEARVYQPGDEVRNMDWRVTARAGVPHVKLFREERERPVWLLTDLGPTMRFGTRVAFKSTVAARAAALLAWAAADRGDRVGGLVFDETRHRELRPAARARGVLALLRALALPEDSSGGGYPSLEEAVGHLIRLVRPGSLVILLSDFAGLDPARTAWMARLSAGSELILALVQDPMERTPPPPGLYPVRDGARRGLLDAGAPAIRRAYAERFAAHRALLASLALRHRAHLIDLATDRPVGESLALGLGPRPLLTAAGVSP